MSKSVVVGSLSAYMLRLERFAPCIFRRRFPFDRAARLWQCAPNRFHETSTERMVATGGTAVATARLVKSLGGEIAGLAFVVELDFLNGRDKLKPYNVFSLLHYDK